MCPAHTDQLKLKATLTRDVGFYALSILILLITISDRRRDENYPLGTKCIYICLWKAALLFGSYIVYVFVCLYFNQIIDFYRENEIGRIFKFGRGKCGYSAYKSLVSLSFKESPRFLKNKRYKARNENNLYVLEKNVSEDIIECFLWKRLYISRREDMLANSWYLLWFSFEHDNIFSVPHRINSLHCLHRYPKFDAIEVDTRRLIMKLIFSQSIQKQYYLMAPSQDIFNEVVKKCEELMKIWYKLSNDEATYIKTKEIAPDTFVDIIPSLIDFPNKGSFLTLILFIILYPLHLLMYLTVPDLRLITRKDDSKCSVFVAILVILPCLLWLIVGSYVLVVSLEALAKKLSVPNAIIGATVSAAGTSLPNYVASTVAAREGRGDMAIGNAVSSSPITLCVFVKDYVL